jgi:hypothetical protein
MSIVSKKLRPAAVIEYLSEILDQINVGGEDVSRVLASGVISALVPDCTPDNRLYDFKHGGVLAPAGMSAVEETVVQPVANTAAILARELVQFVGLDCLIHDPLKQVGEASKADGEPLLVEGLLFYLNRHCFQSVEECQKTVRRNTLNWYFLLIVGRYPQPENLSLKSIVLNSTCIVVGAYDGESYLVWRPD